MARTRLVSLLALGASFFALSVIALGAFTRLMDAGLGCPDWPGCYGHLFVPTNAQAVIAYPGTHLVAYKAWAEMIHRYFVGCLSIFIIVIIGTILSKKESRTCSNLIFTLCLLLLLIYQIILGQLTVTLKLFPVIVSQHLLGGFFILSILWLIYLNNRTQQPIKQAVGTILPFAVIALLLLLMQISLGAWTSTNYASLSCSDFPFCTNDHPAMTLYFKQAFNLMTPLGVNYEGGVLPQVIRQTIQMTHRLGALILTVYLFSLMVYAMFKLKFSPLFMRLIYIILGLLCIQVLLGMANVVFQLPLVTAMSHTIVAAILLQAVITFIYKLVICRKVSSL